MTLQETLTAFGTSSTIIIATRSGVKYYLYRDVVEAADPDNPYVYGDRVDNKPRGPFARQPNTTQWFLLKNVSLA